MSEGPNIRIASARDVDRWMRAVFESRLVLPKQQAEWMAR